MRSWWTPRLELTHEELRQEDLSSRVSRWLLRPGYANVSRQHLNLLPLDGPEEGLHFDLKLLISAPDPQGIQLYTPWGLLCQGKTSNNANLEPGDCWAQEVIHSTRYKEPVSLVHKEPFAQCTCKAMAWTQLILLTKDSSVVVTATRQTM